MANRHEFLPITRKDMEIKGWDRCDFIMITGDAYVDHPGFGTAILSRILQREGYRVGILPQPNWKAPESVMRLGRPRYAFLITSGNMDSMVSHYTAAKKRRRGDAYSPGGRSGARPDRAVIVYTNLVRAAYKDVSVVIGGLEASLRRLAHYDYWDDRVRRSVLLDSKADLLVYGMGEKPLLEIAEYMRAGVTANQIRHVRGTVYVDEVMPQGDAVDLLPSFETVSKDKRAYAETFGRQTTADDPHKDRVLVQPHGDRFVVQNPPTYPLGQVFLDEVYDLPFTREVHPQHLQSGGVPAFNDMRFSITAQRGCFGECSFCAIGRHQGRHIQARGHDSILREARWMTRQKDFKGNIQDVGGPTANFRKDACDKAAKSGYCDRRSCLAPKPCPNLKADHREFMELLEKLEALDGVRKVFIKSGIRYDYLMKDASGGFLEKLCASHVSGQLKVAPEHVSEKVLNLMNKPGFEAYDAFRKAYFEKNRQLGKDQYLVPYFISGHPGSGLKEAVELAEYIKSIDRHPEQVQDFYPTPGTLSTAMYHTGLDPRTMEPIHVPKGREKALQRALLQYWLPQNRQKVLEALHKANRMDLVGWGGDALIRPDEKERGKVVRHDRKRKTGTHKRTRKKTKE